MRKLRGQASERKKHSLVRTGDHSGGDAPAAAVAVRTCFFDLLRMVIFGMRSRARARTLRFAIHGVMAFNPINIIDLRIGASVASCRIAARIALRCVCGLIELMPKHQAIDCCSFGIPACHPIIYTGSPILR